MEDRPLDHESRRSCGGGEEGRGGVSPAARGERCARGMSTCCAVLGSALYIRFRYCSELLDSTAWQKAAPAAHRFGEGWSGPRGCFSVAQ